jgi:predicted Holliday junction resolvase-like endonuclease
MAELQLIWGFVLFIISIILVYSIVSTANSNARIRKSVEQLHEEIYKANIINGIHDKWEKLEQGFLEKEEREKAERKANKKGWF